MNVKNDMSNVSAKSQVSLARTLQGQIKNFHQQFWQEIGRLPN